MGAKREFEISNLKRGGLRNAKVNRGTSSLARFDVALFLRPDRGDGQ